MTAELLIIFLVGLIVFGPQKLPMVAEHLAKIIRFIAHIRQETQKFWDSQCKSLTLEENERKAKKADAQYKNEDS